MAVFVGIFITLAFGLVGLLVALRLCPERRESSEQRDKFLLTALVCIALAMVLSGFVRRPLVRLLRTPPATVSDAAAENIFPALPSCPGSSRARAEHAGEHGFPSSRSARSGIPTRWR